MLIFISGKFGSGKDTLAEALVSHFNGIHKKLATPVKEIASMLGNVPVEACYTDQGKKIYLDTLGMTLGTLQQRIGEGMRQVIHPDVWLLMLLGQYKTMQEKRYFIVSDCRYPNEADAARALGGIVIRLERSSVRFDGRDPNHPSETSLDNYQHFDLIIRNDGTIQEMVEKAIEFLENKQ